MAGGMGAGATRGMGDGERARKGKADEPVWRKASQALGSGAKRVAGGISCDASPRAARLRTV
jgi:hypothetical protein